MKLNFTINELCQSSVAAANNIDNTPNGDVIDNLFALIRECLQPIRNKYGRPIRVNSGYRCEKLNKLIGGAKSSQHLTGCAADIVGINNTTEQLKAIAKAALTDAFYDQLIIETNARGARWLHISHNNCGAQRKELLIYESGKYRKVSESEFNCYLNGLC